MGWRDDPRWGRKQIWESGRGQGRALGRIGPRANFVEESQRIVTRRVDDTDDVAHVRRKRRKALLDALFVANIGEDIVKDTNLRSGSRRNVEARLGHERQEASRLQGDRLTARVWSSNHHHPEVVAQPERN